MHESTWVHKGAKLMVDFLFYLGIICVTAIPIWVKPFLNFYGFFPKDLFQISVYLLLSGMVAVYILFVLKQMFKTLLDGNPFTVKNVSYFRRISVACAINALIFLVKFISYPTITSLIIITIFVLGCLFCLTLKDIFKQAVAYKEENDWTV